MKGVNRTLQSHDDCGDFEDSSSDLTGKVSRGNDFLCEKVTSIHSRKIIPKINMLGSAVGQDVGLLITVRGSGVGDVKTGTICTSHLPTTTGRNERQELPELSTHTSLRYPQRLTCIEICHKYFANQDIYYLPRRAVFIVGQIEITDLADCLPASLKDHLFGKLRN